MKNDNNINIPFYLILNKENNEYIHKFGFYDDPIMKIEFNNQDFIDAYEGKFTVKLGLSMITNGRVKIDWWQTKTLSDFVYSFKTTKKDWENFKESDVNEQVFHNYNRLKMKY